MAKWTFFPNKRHPNPPRDCWQKVLEKTKTPLKVETQLNKQQHQLLLPLFSLFMGCWLGIIHPKQVCRKTAHRWKTFCCNWDLSTRPYLMLFPVPHFRLNLNENWVKDCRQNTKFVAYVFMCAKIKVENYVSGSEWATLNFWFEKYAYLELILNLN